ncbi:uncharacterized protein LOC136074482 [Hydra vulgaris]|uniref:Uncharacterized protein LOC136074482 n=1 Tax=Hydra vulgaris TaxID=6087 RepID=A0ABM4B246_HYDVU
MVTVYVNIFASILIKPIRKNNKLIKENMLTLHEYNKAFNLLLFIEQFCLRNQDNYEKLSSSLKSFTDEQNVMRLKGRFGNSILSYNKKYPIILRDGQHSYFTVLIIRDTHVLFMHHGIEMTLSQVRARFWIIKGRKTVKNFLRKCVICKKISGRTILPPPTPDLPDYCVNVSIFSFQSVGVDFVGP